VYITDRGRLSHVLLTFADYQRLEANQPSIIELLAEPAGVEDADFEVAVSRETPVAARFD
jgi:hypothetical protein